MITLTGTLVDIPDDKGVHIKTAGAKNEKYVYKYIKYFRNKDGEPRSKAKAIGKLDAITGRMYPNRYYYEMYSVVPSMPDISVWDYGYTYLVLKVCLEIGLHNCLRKALGSDIRAMEAIIMASYIIREGSAMDAIDDWQCRNYFPGFDRLLTSQACSKAFASITEPERQGFFKQWVKHTFKGGSVCYDVTSISSYSQLMTDVERGYNRDGESLCQFNLGMFCDEATKTPLYYSRYNGSLTDKTNLSYVLAGARALGVKNVKMIVDGGFWSGECIESLNGCCDAFTMGMPSSLKESEKLLAEKSAGIDTYANELSCRHIYCVQTDVKLHDVVGKVLLFYDSLSHVRLCEELSGHIERLKAELAKLKRYPKSRLGRYAPYFKVTKHERDTGFDYAVDTEKVDNLRKLKGFFLLFTTDMESSPSDILYYYRAKDADEKIFSQIKVEMGCNRFRTHNEATTEGKAFIVFIACVIRSYLLAKLAPLLSETSSSLKKVLNQLANIIVISAPDGLRLTKALTKKQKEILAVFGPSDDILASFAQQQFCLR